MPSKIDIASNALMLVGESPITSFTDNGAGALAANSMYDIAYETMLTEHRWTFANKKAQLSLLVADPLNEWSHAFQLPGDVLVVYGVYPDAKYFISEDKVWSNVNELAINYIFKPDESKLPPYFITALQNRLASLFAVFISDDNTMANLYGEQAHESLMVAKRIDSQSRSTQRIKSSPFIAVR